MKPIPYGRQNITPEDIKEVTRVLKSDFLTQGPEIGKFEEEFAKYVGAKYAVAVNNGTSALHLCTTVLDVNPGDKVISTPITFAASSNCVRYRGGEVLFADINPDTFLIDIESVKKIISEDVNNEIKGIIAVDFAGYPVDLIALRELANENNLWIVEDACHAPGGYFKDSDNIKHLCGNGELADLAVFSFHPVKHIATAEGGMITTNNKELYDKLLLYRNHGITKDQDLLEENHGGWYYEMQELGFNYRLTDIQAALGSNQLKRADKGLKRRNEIAERYDSAFEKSIVQTPYRSKDIFHAFHLYVIQVEDRKGLYDFLRENNIFTQVHYIPIYNFPYYKNLGLKIDCPNADNYYKKCLSLPMYPTLTNEEQDFVIDKINEFIASKSH